jgi:uncharacterized membrane protein YfcA
MREELLWPALIFVLAGLVKGSIGMGLPTVSLALLGLRMSPVQAAALIVVPSLVTNLWQAAAGGAFARLTRRMWALLICLVLGTWSARFLGVGLEQSSASVGLGVALALYGAYGLLARPPRIAAKAEHWLSATTGLLTGIATGATGVFVMPSVPYLQALGLSKDELVQALGIVFTLATLALAAFLIHGGAFDLRASGISTALLVPALIGMALGQRVRSRVSATTFRRFFFIGTLLLGVHLASRAWLPS